MDHLGAGRGQRQRGRPGVGKEGENPRAARGRPFEPGPLRCLLQEQPGLTGSGGADLEVERRGTERDRHPPSIGKRPELSPATGEPRRLIPSRDAAFPLRATGVA